MLFIVVTVRESGTQQPQTFCDVEYYGLRSPKTGTVVHPESSRFKSHSGNIKCKQHFIPASNQVVIITVSFIHAVKLNYLFYNKFYAEINYKKIQFSKLN